MADVERAIEVLGQPRTIGVRILLIRR